MQIPIVFLDREFEFEASGAITEDDQQGLHGTAHRGL